MVEVCGLPMTYEMSGCYLICVLQSITTWHPVTERIWYYQSYTYAKDATLCGELWRIHSQFIDLDVYIW